MLSFLRDTSASLPQHQPQPYQPYQHSTQQAQYQLPPMSVATEQAPVTIQCPYTASNCPLFNPIFTDSEVLSSKQDPSPASSGPGTQQRSPSPASPVAAAQPLTSVSYSDYSLAPSPSTYYPPHLSAASRQNSSCSSVSAGASSSRAGGCASGGCGSGGVVTPAPQQQQQQQQQQPPQQQQQQGQHQSIREAVAAVPQLGEPGHQRSRSVERDVEDLFGFFVPNNSADHQQQMPKVESQSPSAESDDGRSVMSYTSPTPEVVTPFISKLSHLLAHADYSDFIRWTPAGDAFVFVHTSPALLDLFARFFRHANIHSFVRQLNIYGFVRLSTLSLLSAIDSLPFSPVAAQYSAADYSGFSHPAFFRDSALRRCDLSAIKPKASKTGPRKPSASRARKVKDDGGVGKAPRRRVAA